MENMIENLLKMFEDGKMDRRQLVRSLAVSASAAGVVGTIGSVPASAASVGVTKIDHISYRVANYAKTRDFYTGLLGLKLAHEKGETGALIVGNMEIHVNGTKDPLHDVDGKSTPLHTPYIDHIDYVSDQSPEMITAELNKRGMKSHPKGNSFRVKDPDGFDVTISAKKA